MATRINNDVTLSHNDAETAAGLLGEYATANTNHAMRTRSAAVRGVCERDAETARSIAGKIVSSLWTWEGGAK